MYKIMPRGYKEKIKNWFKFAGSKKDPKTFVNYAFSISFALGFIVAFLVGTQYFALIWIAVFFSMFALFHGFLILAIDRRARFVEKILPDALQLMAANSRAGYIPSRALILSARPEFGPLSDAIKKVGKEILTGKPMEEAMKKIPEFIKSEVLERSVKLIIEGTKAGGKFASLLEENANDIRRIQAIKKEVRANILMYTIFIGFAGAIGAPVLYAMSSYLTETIQRFGALAEGPGELMQQVPFMRFGGLDISSEFLLGFSVVAILVTTVFGGIIIGLIGSGKETAGIKYIPILVIIALVVFFITRIFVGGIFSSILPT